MPNMDKWREKLSRLLGKRNTRDKETQEIRGALTDAGYYEEVSLRYASAQLIGMMLLAVFVAVSLLTNASLLSSDNLVFFAKDMTTALSAVEREARDTVVYTADADNRYTLFRDGLAALGSDKLTVFTATGREAYTARHSYASPHIVSLGRYLITYDLGGRSYDLYNSFACVKSGQAEAAIRGAAAANNGYYAIITDGTEYASRVTLYNDRFQAINRYNLKEYTVCADLDEQGERLLLASVSAQNGRMTTHLLLATPGQGEADAAWTVSDAYPVAAHITDDGLVMLLSTDFVCFFDAEGNELSRHSIDTDRVVAHRTGSFGCVIVLRAASYDANAEVLAFNAKGQLCHHLTFTDSVRDAVLFGTTLSVLTDGMLACYAEGSDEAFDTAELTGQYTRIEAYAEGENYVCGEAKAITVRMPIQ